MSSYIQNAHADWLGSSISNMSFPSAVTVGSAIVVYAWSYAGMGTVTHISDGVNIYNEVGSKYYPSGTWSVQTFVAVNVAAGTPSLAFTTTGQYWTVFMVEYGNISAVDQTVDGHGSSAPSVGPSGTTTATNETIVAGFWTSGTATAVAPYGTHVGINKANTIDFSYQIIEDQDVTAKAAYTATVVDSAWVGRMITLVQAGGPSPTAAFPNIPGFWMG